MRRLRARPELLAAVLLMLAACAVVALADSWRSALAVTLAAAALAATGVRFSVHVGAAVLAVAVLLALAGRLPASSARPVSAVAHHHQHAPAGHGRQRTGRPR